MALLGAIGCDSAYADEFEQDQVILLLDAAGVLELLLEVEGIGDPALCKVLRAGAGAAGDGEEDQDQAGSHTCSFSV